MRVDAKMFAEQAVLILDKSERSIGALSKRSGVGRSTLYRVLYEPKLYIERNTAAKIAEGLGASIEFKGKSVRLYLENKSLKEERHIDDKLNMTQEGQKVEHVIRRMNNKLRTIDYDVLLIADELVDIIMDMEKEDVVSLHKIHKMLKLEKNRKMFVKKLEALGTLVMPYETEEEEEKIGEG